MWKILSSKPAGDSTFLNRLPPLWITHVKSLVIRPFLAAAQLLDPGQPIAETRRLSMKGT
jgi:hypothetical protein